MRKKLSWLQVCRSQEFCGKWVALDNCRFDETTLKPVEGDVVDCDEELPALCARMRETGRSSCSIVFCDGDVYVETQPQQAQDSPIRTDRPAWSQVGLGHALVWRPRRHDVETLTSGWASLQFWG